MKFLLGFFGLLISLNCIALSEVNSEKKKILDSYVTQPEGQFCIDNKCIDLNKEAL